MKLSINIDGKQYEADIEVIEEERVEPVATARTPRPKTGMKSPAAAPVAPEAPSGDTSSNACKSSIVGIVVKVLVSVGQSVKKGDPVIVLEAMKMESNVVAPIDGSIGKIHIAPGDSVKKGQVLIDFS